MFKSSVVAAASGFLMLWGLAPMANATYIIGPDSFDVPPYTNNANIVGQQGWQGISANGGTGAQIINDGTGSGRGTSLFIDNADGTSQVYRAISAPNNTSTTQIMRVKYDIYGTLDDYYYATPWVMIGDNFGTGYIAAFVEGMAYNGGGLASYKFRLNGDGNNTISGISSKPNFWYSFTIDLSFADKTYDVSVTDGTYTGTASNVPFWYDSVGYPVPGLNDITFRTTSSAGNYANTSGYIDNFSVEMIAVPEPASLSLLGLGLGALVMRRRR
ncbi:MAG: PEP-CTERM sorting domain-containing protein [Phycisphaerales bacterium]|nr:PEP-CTERM sorting domain-containing protein [Phycisphaerales bacterium]